MTPVTALHRPPAGRPRFRRHLTVAPAPPKTGATQPSMLKSPGREPQRRTTTDGDHRSTADYAGQRILHGTGRTINPHRRQTACTGPPRVLSLEGFGRRPSARWRIDRDKPASETL